MKKLFRAIFIFAYLSISLNSSAQDYLITFAGTGASTTVSTVEVENLVTGKTLTINGSDILHLTSVVGISQLENNSSSGMRIYPNPMTDNSLISLHPPIAGDAVITVFEMTGKIVAQIHTYLENSRQEFRLSDLKNGMYLINVTGNYYQYTGKILSSGQANGNPGIAKVSNTTVSKIEKISKKEFSVTQGTIDMQYTLGDRLKFKASSGIYSTVKTDIPTENKTLTFNFIPCTDGDNNNYQVVEIGTQIWMAENLKTTKYRDNLDISLIEDGTTWSALSTPGYCWYNNDEAKYKTTYGALYNWFTINTGSLCPTGWHVPSDAEWTVLVNYLGGESRKLKSVSGWNSGEEGTNTSGFTALPVGTRYSVGTFDPITDYELWWSSTENGAVSAWYRYLDGSNGAVYRGNNGNKQDGFSVRCLNDSELAVLKPILTTIDISAISATNAISGGNISSDGRALVTARGVCYSITINPTTSNSITTDGAGTGSFASSMVGLTPVTQYYVRAYATNIAGTSYGNEISFTTMPAGPTNITDADGNVYNTVIIGTQTWMMENLKTTKYNNSSDISLIEDGTTWSALSTPGYCWYNNDEARYKTTYGALYNWFTVNTGNLCPTGWHVPSDAEWNVLTDFLGGEAVAGGKLKETGYSHWSIPNYNASNGSGFTAYPGGCRFSNGAYNPNSGRWGSWWSFTEFGTGYAFSRDIYASGEEMFRNWSEKQLGFSVRCLKDSETPVIIPTLTTTAVSAITETNATSGGNVSSDGGATVTARGVCYSTTTNPTTLNNTTNDGSGTGQFSSSLTGLTTNTTYFVRAYVTNNVGTFYGNEISFTTSGISIDGSFTDWDAIENLYGGYGTSSGTLSEVKVKTNAGNSKLYVYLKGTFNASYPVIEIFINADGDTNTGWKTPLDYASNGTEYLMEFYLLDGWAGVYVWNPDPVVQDWPWSIDITNDLVNGDISETSGVIGGSEMEFVIKTSLMKNPVFADKIGICFWAFPEDWSVISGALPPVKEEPLEHIKTFSFQ